MSEVGNRALKQNASAVVAEAAALDLGDDLEGLVTYDDRLSGAADANAITAIGPK